MLTRLLLTFSLILFAVHVDAGERMLPKPGAVVTPPEFSSGIATRAPTRCVEHMFLNC
jgi:hypothetical protein